MPKISLDQIRETAKQNFTSLEIDTGEGEPLRLRSPLRLSDAEREEFDALASDLAKAENDDEVSVKDVHAKMIDILVLVSDDPEAMRSFADSLDLAEIATLYTYWGDEVGAPKSVSGS